jgi:hypothetical protein
MDWTGPVLCMYVCVGTVFHPYEPTDPLVMARVGFVLAGLESLAVLGAGAGACGATVARRWWQRLGGVGIRPRRNRFQD